MKAIQSKIRVLIKSAPGLGKSDLTEQTTKEAGADFVLMHPAICDPTDFKGLPVNVKGLAEFLPYGELRRLIEATKTTVCFLDDIGQAAPAVQAALMQVVQARRIGEHKVSDHVTFIGATNDTNQQAGVSGMIEPLKSRWDSIVTMEFSLDDWCAWASAHNMPTELIAWARFQPGKISPADWKPSREIKPTACPRTWHSVGKWLNADVSNPEILGGAVGEAYAIEFCAFLKLISQLPNLDDIIANPSAIPIPHTAGAQYAVAAGLARKATAQNMGAILTYMQRINAEFTVFCVKDALARDSKIAECKAMVSWFSKNAKVLA